MVEPEIVPQRRIDDLDRHSHELPALLTDVRFVATCPDLIVVRQVYIEDEFFRQRSKGGGFAECLAVARVCGVNGPNFEPGRVES